METTTIPATETETLPIDVTQPMIDLGCHSSDNCPVYRGVAAVLTEYLGEPPLTGEKGYALTVGTYQITVEYGPLRYRKVDCEDGEKIIFLGVDMNSPDYIVYEFYQGGKPSGKWIKQYDDYAYHEAGPVAVDFKYVPKPFSFELPVTDKLRAIKEALHAQRNAPPHP